MLQLYHHHNTAIRSQGNAPAMKKLTFAVTLLIAMLGSRGFIEPQGMNVPALCGDLSYGDLLEKLRAIVDTYAGDIPFKNIASYLENVLLSYVSDAYDRRVCRLYIQTMFIPDLLEDGFSACRGGDAEKWLIPSDVPAGSFMQAIQQIPLFAGLDILQMHSRLSTPLRNWCLSRWVLEAFCDKKKGFQIPMRDAVQSKVDGFLIMLPERINIADETKFKGLCLHCLLREIEKINIALMGIRASLFRDLERFKNGVCSELLKRFLGDEVPDEWKELAGLYYTSQMTHFATHIIQRHSFLMNWLQNQNVEVIDARMIDNLRAFMIAFASECAVQMRTTVDSLTYEFQLMGTGEVGETAFVLTNLYLFCGGLSSDGGLTTPEDEKAVTFIPVSSMACKVVRKTSVRGKSNYVCPLYKRALCRGVNRTLDDLEIVEGVNNNLVWECGLYTEKLEGDFIGYGTALFCRIPDNLSS
jgi:hypothetical protein